MTVGDCLEVMEWAYRDLAEGKAVEELRQRMFVDSKGSGQVYGLGRQAAALPRFGIAALRITSSRRQEARQPRDYHLVLLFGLESGELLAILQGFTLSGLRLGATTGLAAKYLARSNGAGVGVLGSGKQARANLEGIIAATGIKRTKIFSPNSSHRTLFCEEMARKLKIEVIPVEQPREVFKDSAVVLCASNAWEPIFDGNWIEEGTLVISLRNSDLNKRPREFDETTVRRSSFVVVCAKKQLQSDNQREILDPIEHGAVGWENVHELAELVAGKVPGRRSSNEIIFYHSNVGMGIQFAAAGFQALNIARERKFGRELPQEWFFTDMSPWLEMGFHPTS